jgi:hypothetical protein
MELSEKDKKAAQAFARLGGLKGGKARAEALTPEERREIAREAATARWSKEKKQEVAKLPQETHTGVLQIGDREIPCSVLDNGLRVLSISGLSRAMGSRKKGLDLRLEDRENPSPQLPPFLYASNIKSSIPKDLMAPLISPIRYKMKSAGIALGYEATLLPRICEVILDANKDGILTARQQYLVDTADILIRGFATIGIIALVDEATGYQSVRPQDALQAYLELIIRKELAAWVKKFPDEFYENIYKLKGWIWPGMQKNRFSVVAHYTRDLVYERLAPGLLEELERKSPKDEKGNRKNKLHDWPTDDIGNPLLAQHLYTLMKFQQFAIVNSYTWSKYVKMVDQVLPKRGANLELPLINQIS